MTGTSSLARAVETKELRVDGRRADGATDLAHGLAHGVEEGAAGVLHQMPSLGHLHRLGQRPGGGEGVATATIARDGVDLRLPRELCLGGGGLSIR